MTLFHAGDIVRRKPNSGLGREDTFQVRGFTALGNVIDEYGVNHFALDLELVECSLPLAISPTDHQPEPEDVVNHPSHYKTAGGLEAIDVIEQFGLGRDFRLGNAAKYLLRAGKKDDELQDIKKAIWYLQRYVDKNESTK